MLRKLTDEIQYAYQRAAHAGEQAEKAMSGEEKCQWLALERSWLKLAESYDASQRLQVFINHQARKG